MGGEGSGLVGAGAAASNWMEESEGLRRSGDGGEVEWARRGEIGGEIGRSELVGEMGEAGVEPFSLVLRRARMLASLRSAGLEAVIEAELTLKRAPTARPWTRARAEKDEG